MNIFNKRPLLLALFVFTFCSVVCATLTFSLRKQFVCLSFLILVIILVITVFSAIFKRKLYKPLLILTLCIFFALIAGISSHRFFDHKLKNTEKLGVETNVIAVIKECTYSASYLTTYTADIKSINGTETNFTASISATPPIYLVEGDTIRADMSFSAFSTNKYGYDARKSSISNGIFTSAEFSNVTLIDNSENLDFVSLFNNLRRRIERIIDKRFDNTAPIIKALLIGKTDDIDTATKSSFSRLGISHILSISGTHFSVLLGMIALLLSCLSVNKRIIYVILIPLALFYMGLSGFSFSVCRAGIMALLSYWGFLCGRQRDAYTALFISLTVILIAAPYAVLSISLWLSFTATFTILVILDSLSIFLSDRSAIWYKRIANYIILHVIISVSVIFTTLPIVAIYFGYISKIAPIANLIIVPLFEVFLYIVPFSVFFSNIPINVEVTEELGTELLTIVKEFASKSNLLIAVNQNFVIVFAILGITATLVLVAIPLKKKLLIALPSVICILSIVIGLLCFYNARRDETHVSYFTSGISDAFIITDSNKTACIDITAGTSAAMYYAQEVAKEQHSVSLSAYIFTHYRSGHIKMFDKLASRMEIETVYFPIPMDEKGIGYMNDIISVAEKHNIKIVKTEYNTPIRFETCEITIFEPQFIRRSSHEIISVYVSTDLDDMLYLGSSFADGKSDYSKFISDAEYIIFGQHYPKIKNEFSVESDATLIYGNKQIYDMSLIHTNAYVLSEDEKYYFLLK